MTGLLLVACHIHTERRPLFGVACDYASAITTYSGPDVTTSVFSEFPKSIVLQMIFRPTPVDIVGVMFSEELIRTI